jgi:plastocyanin
MAKANLTITTDFRVKAREVDFVTRFTKNWDSLREVLGIMRPIRKDPGTTLASYEAYVTLQSGNVGEGEEIPYSKAGVRPVAYGDLTLEKYAKAVSIESVNKYGAAVAVQKTDAAFLNELQGNVLDRFYTFLQTGTLKFTEATFQMAIAMVIGKVVDKFKKMRRDYTNIVVFVNTIDAYRYLGAANLTVQNQFGIQYIKDFLGAQTMILSSEIPSGKVIATPAENIILYYVDPGDSDFKELGLDYTVQGETNLIGFHANGNYNTAVGESFALMGLMLWAEYLDAVAVCTIGASGAGLTFDKEEVTVTVGGTVTNALTKVPANATVTFTSSDTTVATVSNAGVVTGVAIGAATITAADATNGTSESFTVTVVPAVDDGE